jgi:hypothetical protein
VRRLGLVINIGLAGRVYPARRRWFSTHFIDPKADPKRPDAVVPIPLSLWNNVTDTFEHADQAILNELAAWAGMAKQDFNAALKERADCLRTLSLGAGVSPNEMYDALTELRDRSKRP